MTPRLCGDCGTAFIPSWPRRLCGPCRGRRYREAHPHRVAASRQRYSTQHAEAICVRNRKANVGSDRWAAKLDHMKAYYQQHSEREKEQKRLYYVRNRRHVLERVERYRQEHPTVSASVRHRRRARKRAADIDGTLTPATVERLYRAARRCPDCRRRLTPRNRSLDHIYPLSLGGAHSILNVRVICRRCNSRKHARLPRQLPLAYNALRNGGP